MIMTAYLSVLSTGDIGGITDYNSQCARFIDLENGLLGCLCAETIEFHAHLFTTIRQAFDWL